MKKFSKYIFTLAALAFATTACVQESDYQKGAADVEGCYGVYFPTQEAAGSHTYDPSQATEAVFTVVRTNSEGDITVPVKYTESHEGIFQLGELVFADGQTESTLKVTFPNSENGVDYKLSLSIEDPQYASRYNDGATNLDFSVLRVEWKYFLNPQTNKPANFTFTQTWWEEVHTGKVKYYEVNGVRTCVTETDPYTYSDGVGYGFWGTGSEPGDKEFHFTWYPKSKLDEEETMDAVTRPLEAFWNRADLGDIYNLDAYGLDYYFLGKTEDDALTYALKNPETANYYDNNGSFAFYTTYNVNAAGSGWSVMAYDVFLDAEGFIRTDYSLVLKAGQSSEGQLPVLFTAGADVASVKYAAFEGALYATQVAKNVEEIVAGTVESMTVSAADLAAASNVLSVSFAETGVYTVVAVTYDAAGSAQQSASVSFSYVAADDEVPVVLTVGLGSADKYVPAGVNTDTALEYWAYGQDLESVKLGVFSAQDIDKDIDACVEKVAASASVKAEIIEEINGEGYVSVVEKLNPGTEYYLIAVASNGYETEAFISNGVYTTGDPHPVFMNFSTADLVDELLPATSEGYFGTYNYYARTSDEELNLSSVREYVGQVTISDSAEADLPADEYGYITEYVNVKGFFGAAAKYFGFDDTMPMESYAGVLYQLSSYFGEGSGYNWTVQYATEAGDLYGHNNNYTMLGGFVQEGYIAFMDATGGRYNFNGWTLNAYSDAEYSSSEGVVDYVADVLLVSPDKDDSGLAPKPTTSSAQLKQISNTLAMGPTNYVETERGNIRSVIDQVRQTPVLRGEFTSIKGEREAKAVEFKATASDVKIQKATRYDNPSNTNISLR